MRSGSNFPESGGQLSGVAQIVPHPDYIESSLRNNIALLRLAEPVSFTDIVIDSQQLIPGDNVTLTGWNTLVPLLPIFNEVTHQFLARQSALDDLRDFFLML